MKMPKKYFNELREDCIKVVEFYGKGRYESVYSFGSLTAKGWLLFADVQNNRNYDDSHPAYIAGIWQRVIPCWDKSPYFYYDDLNLNDSHIETALKRIVSEIWS